MAPTASEKRIERLENRDFEIIEILSKIREEVASTHTEVNNLSCLVAEVKILSAKVVETERISKEVDALSVCLAEVKGVTKTHGWLLKLVTGVTVLAFLGSMASSALSCGTRGSIEDQNVASAAQKVDL